MADIHHQIRKHIDRVRLKILDERQLEGSNTEGTAPPQGFNGLFNPRVRSLEAGIELLIKKLWSIVTG